MKYSYYSIIVGQEWLSCKGIVKYEILEFFSFWKTQSKFKPLKKNKIPFHFLGHTINVFHYTFSQSSVVVGVVFELSNICSVVLLLLVNDGFSKFSCCLGICMVLTTKLLGQCEILFFYSSLLIKKVVDSSWTNSTVFCASYTPKTPKLSKSKCYSQNLNQWWWEHTEAHFFRKIELQQKQMTINYFD